jgi:beta-glucosidase
MADFPFRDQSLPLEQRVDDLISRLTAEEKVFQLTNDAASVPRLGIRAYNYWNEALHGVARAGVATVFPQAIGLAAMFNRPLLKKVATVISDEGRAKYNEFQRQGDCGIYKGLTYWSPNINIFRDPRWGRGHETYGEDPYLTGTLGVAFIHGLQGDDPHYLKAAACAKHYAVHSGPEQLRHSFNVEIDNKDLFETYLPAFEMCVKEGKVESVMGAYNAVNGEPCNCNTELLSDILRKRWGFEGHVVSDCGAINDFHANHHYTGNIVESAAMGVKRGCDLNCGGVYKHLLQSLEQGLIEETDLDACLRRVLRARFKLGMFDDPADVPYSSIPFETVASTEHRDFNRAVARRTIALLKNDGILPLKKGTKIALVGPNADHKLANYNGTPSYSYTALEGLRYYLGENAPIGYAAGCRHVDMENPWEEGGRLNGAISVAERSDVIVMCVGLDAGLEGEQGDAHNAYGSGDKPYLELPPAQQRLVEAMVATGKPLITVLFAGSAMAIGYAHEHSNAVIDAFYPGEQGGIALAEILFRPPAHHVL